MPDGLRHHNNSIKLQRRHDITTLKRILSALLADADPIPLRKVLAAIRAQGHQALAEAPSSKEGKPVLRAVFLEAMREERIRKTNLDGHSADIYAPGESKTRTGAPNISYPFLTRLTEKELFELRKQIIAMR